MSDVLTICQHFCQFRVCDSNSRYFFFRLTKLKMNSCNYTIFFLALMYGKLDAKNLSQCSITNCSSVTDVSFSLNAYLTNTEVATYILSPNDTMTCIQSIASAMGISCFRSCILFNGFRHSLSSREIVITVRIGYYTDDIQYIYDSQNRLLMSVTSGVLTSNLQSVASTMKSTALINAAVYHIELLSAKLITHTTVTKSISNVPASIGMIFVLVFFGLSMISVAVSYLEELLRDLPLIFFCWSFFLLLIVLPVYFACIDPYPLLTNTVMSSSVLKNETKYLPPRNATFVSSRPTSVPSFQPSTTPTASPTLQPSTTPSLQPSTTPTTTPTVQPSPAPTVFYLQCSYPYTQLDKDSTTCTAFSLGFQTNNVVAVLFIFVTLFIGALFFASLDDVQGASKGSKYFFVYLMINLLLPLGDTLTNVTYMLTAKFYRIEIYIIMVAFYIIPAIMLILRLVEYGAWPRIFYWPRRFIWLNYFNCDLPKYKRVPPIADMKDLPYTHYTPHFYPDSWYNKYGQKTLHEINEMVQRDYPRSTLVGDRGSDHQYLPEDSGPIKSLCIGHRYDHESLFFNLLELLVALIYIVLQVLYLIALVTFIIVQLLFLVFWFPIGVLLLWMKIDAAGGVWNMWFNGWTGCNKKFVCSFEPAEIKSSIDTEVLNGLQFFHIFVESIPNLFLQALNSSLVGEKFSPVAILSILVSTAQIASVTWSLVYYRYFECCGVKRMPLKDIEPIMVCFDWKLPKVKKTAPRKICPLHIFGDDEGRRPLCFLFFWKNYIQPEDHIQPDRIKLDDYIQPKDHIPPDEHIQPDRIQPDEHIQPDDIQPDDIQLDHIQPDQIQPDHIQPDHIQPEFIG